MSSELLPFRQKIADKKPLKPKEGSPHETIGLATNSLSLIPTADYRLPTARLKSQREEVRR